MEYILLFSVPLITSIVRILQKKFKLETKEVKQASNIYLIIICIFAMIVFAFMAKGNLTPNLPTILFALALALFSASTTLFSLLALDKTDVATIAMFGSAGSIIIPFVFGIIFLNEQVSVFKILTFFLFLTVILMPLFEKNKSDRKNSFLGYTYCIFLFLASGSSTVLFKLYALAENVLSTNIFCFWTNAFMLPVAILIALKSNPKELINDALKIKPLSYAFVVLTVLFSNISSVLQVFILKDVDITLFTLLNSPTALVLTAFISWGLFSEKITKKMALSILLSILGIILSVI